MDNYSRLLQELEQIPQVQGIVPTDILELPENLSGLLRTLMRQGAMTAKALSVHLDVTVKQANDLGEQLAAKGYLLSETGGTESGPLFRVYYARMRKQNIPSQLL